MFAFRSFNAFASHAINPFHCASLCSGIERERYDAIEMGRGFSFGCAICMRCNFVRDANGAHVTP